MFYPFFCLTCHRECYYEVVGPKRMNRHPTDVINEGDVYPDWNPSSIYYIQRVPLADGESCEPKG